MGRKLVPITVDEESAAAREILYAPKTLPLYDWYEQELAKDAPSFLLHDAVMPGGLTIVGGRAKSQKSFHTQLMVLALSSGQKVGFYDPMGFRSRVLILDLEGVAQETAKRLGRLCRGHGLEPQHAMRNAAMYTKRTFELLANGNAAELSMIIKDLGTQVVVIDTLARSFTGDENSKRDIQKFLDTLSEIREATGVAVVVVHHVNKAQFQYKDSAVFMDADAGLRGSTALSGAYDCILSMQGGWVEGEHQNVMIGQGKYHAPFWLDYELTDSATETDVSSGKIVPSANLMKFGKVRTELGLFERAPSDSQPKYRGGE